MQKCLPPVQQNLDVMEKNGMLNSDSAPQKTQIMIVLINCVFQKSFSVTQCNSPLLHTNNVQCLIDILNLGFTHMRFKVISIYWPSVFVYLRKYSSCFSKFGPQVYPLGSIIIDLVCLLVQAKEIDFHNFDICFSSIFLFSKMWSYFV